MAAPRKYPDELRERATRMAVELRQDPDTKHGAINRVAEQLGMHPETLTQGRLEERQRRRDSSRRIRRLVQPQAPSRRARTCPARRVRRQPPGQHPPEHYPQEPVPTGTGSK
jgi:transposase